MSEVDRARLARVAERLRVLAADMGRIADEDLAGVAPENNAAALFERLLRSMQQGLGAMAGDVERSLLPGGAP